ACAEAGAAFVSVSTDYVFDGTARRPYREHDVPAPLNLYGVSKVAGELLAARHGGRWMVVRTSGLYGPAGVSAKGPVLIERLRAQAARGEPVRVVDDVLFSPSYAPHVAAVVRELRVRAARPRPGRARARGCVRRAQAGVLGAGERAARRRRRRAAAAVARGCRRLPRAARGARGFRVVGASVAIQVADTMFAEAKLFVPDVFEDDRGFFKESWSDPKYAALGVDVRWQQDSFSWSSRGVLRGMHYDFRMAKLVQFLHGRIWDAIVDLRRDSPTYLRWQSFVLSADNHKQLFVPAGFAHGFLAL